LKLGKKRRESSKRNYYIISPRVIIKAIIITGLLVEWAAQAKVRECRMVAKADTPSVVQAMCKVRDRQGVW